MATTRAAVEVFGERFTNHASDRPSPDDRRRGIIEIDAPKVDALVGVAGAS